VTLRPVEGWRSCRALRRFGAVRDQQAQAQASLAQKPLATWQSSLAITRVHGGTADLGRQTKKTHKLSWGVMDENSSTEGLEEEMPHRDRNSRGVSRMSAYSGGRGEVY